MNNKIQPENLPSECVELMECIISELPLKDHGPDCALALHLKYLVALSRDAIFLESEGRSRSTPVIARAVLESLFKVMVGVNHPEIAATQTLLEFEWNDIQMAFPGYGQRKIEEIRAKPEYAPIGRSVAALASRWRLPANAHRSAKQYNTWDWAKGAGMAETYKGNYAQMSNYAHATAANFICRRPTTYVLTTISFALLKAGRSLTEQYKAAISTELHTLAELLCQIYRSQAAENKGRFLRELFGLSNPAPRSPDEGLAGN